jgi:hypothetical protein
LNVDYEQFYTTIDIRNLNRLSEVQQKILFAFPQISSGYTSIQLWNKNDNKQVESFAELNNLPQDYFVEGRNPSLSVVLANTKKTGRNN